MDKQIIISIGREYGSGGHEIAEILAKDLNIPLLDNKLLTDIASKNNALGEKIKKYDEKPRNILLSKTIAGFASSIEENLAHLQFDYIKRQAENGESFVVVGRCSEYILRDHPALVSFFILGNTDTKCDRIMRKFGLTYDEARRLMKKKDWTRKTYHNYYCDGKWGDSRNYDLCINVSRIGTDGCVIVLKEYLEQRFGNDYFI